MNPNKRDLEHAGEVLSWLSNHLVESYPHEALNCTMAAGLCFHWTRFVPDAPAPVRDRLPNFEALKIVNGAKRNTKGKVKHAQAVAILQANFPDEAKALAGWKNKTGGLHGWDRFLKTRHPEAASIAWPA